MLESEREIAERDLRTLAGILRGPGNYATPSQDRIDRLMNRGLIVRKRGGRLRATLKGRVVVWMNRFKG
jgi:hypothetical protein